MAPVLAVDDDRSVLQVLCRILEEAGHEPLPAENGSAAVDLVARAHPAVALIDVRLDGLDGFGVADRCHDIDPALPVILCSGYPSTTDAFAAGRRRFFGYLQKPLRKAEILAAIDEALRSTGRGSGPALDPAAAPAPAGFEGMLGRSRAMRAVFAAIARAAPLDETVLILGETGTGKELAARAVHARSRRVGAPFVAVNCSAIPEALFESEFFGHERGAFTDAHTTTQGTFEQAAGGTLFLDEVGELPPGAQAKLLRAVETGEITRVGGRRPIRVDVRLVAATNADLTTLVNRGSFRRDLLARLDAIRLELPPLRSRDDDVELLIDAIVPRLGRRFGKPNLTVSPEAMALLRRYTWPANIRELEHVLLQAALRADDEVLIEHLSREIWQRPSIGSPSTGPPMPEGMSLPEASRRVV